MGRQLLVGLILGCATGWVGCRHKLLSRSGAATVVASTSLTFAWGGWVWGALLLLVFLGSGLCSRYRASHKENVLGESHGPGDWHAIAAGAGWSTVLGLLHHVMPHASSVFVAFVGALAAVNADIWATELGLLGPRSPRLITTRRRVPPGTPGGVSTLGIVASLGAAWVIGLAGLWLVALAAWRDDATWDRALSWLPLTAMAGGMAACLVDSLLGATAQGLHYCERCGKQTQSRIHTCGEATRQIRGWAWLTNETVDLVSSILGAAVAAGVFALLAQSGLEW